MLIVENVMLHIIKNAVFIKRSDIQSIRVSRNISFFETRQVYQKTHGQRVMSYADANSELIGLHAD